MRRFVEEFHKNPHMSAAEAEGKMSQIDVQASATPEPTRTFGEFLRTTPPETDLEVTELTRPDSRSGGLIISEPTLELHCGTCGGLRSFDCRHQTFHLQRGTCSHGYMHYLCRNCKSQTKVYALAVNPGGAGIGRAYKLGELPLFGDPLPPRVFTLLGPDQNLFIQGRRSENRGLGIGALTYYRRVVENQWERIVGEVRKVAEKVGAPPHVIQELKEVARHTQFGRAVDSVKPAVPEMLLIDGHNPLTLLHSALSEAIHDKSDQECLELAHDIRTVLTELAERASHALKDQAELKKAVGRLQSRAEIKKASMKSEDAANVSKA